MTDLAARLDAMGADVRRLDLVAGRRLTEMSHLHSDLVAELQALDHLHQSLQDLARLSRQIGALSNTDPIPTDLSKAWSAELKLESTRRLLLSSDTPAPHLPAQTGIAYLFDTTSADPS
ncbi:hypothetical protein [Sulfitobacter aestuariivivens]|uniref:Uncharacterized protein n=1 Tax=Sulfitobacter aestuariivivens TaxID=2766981 RepID=A0A927D1C5_9RHOB|nr:hypothetical protein [Sulfitobacter aestuariivivens]MBD3663214.1 hypothetical protein [Sulfitobacter aestuariivivens]